MERKPNRIHQSITCTICVLIVLASSPTLSFAARTQVTAGETEWIQAVLVAGNLRIPDEDILGLIKTQVGNVYDEDQVAADRKRIRDSRLFDHVEVKAHYEAESVIVVFTVWERPLISGIEIGGIEQDIESVMELFRQENVKIDDHAPFDRDELDEARKALRKHLKRRGHFSPRIDITVDRESFETVFLRFLIQPGPRARIAEISIEEDTAISDEALLSTLDEVKLGEFYDEAKLEQELENNLLNAYRGDGYLQAEAAPPEVEIVDYDGPSCRVTIMISEGEQFRFGEIEVVIETPEGSVDHPGWSGLVQTGEVADLFLLHTILTKWAGSCSNLGYLDAKYRLDVVPDLESKIADILVALVEGEQYVIRAVQFEFAPPVRNEAEDLRRVEEAFQFEKGMVYNLEHLKLAFARIRQIEGIEEIRYFRLKRPEPGEIDLRIRLTKFE